MTIGDRVTMAAFTDCFGREHPAINGMTVKEINHVNSSLGEYDRILATTETGPVWSVEASDKFFIPEG